MADCNSSGRRWIGEDSPESMVLFRLRLSRCDNFFCAVKAVVISIRVLGMEQKALKDIPSIEKDVQMEEMTWR